MNITNRTKFLHLLSDLAMMATEAQRTMQIGFGRGCSYYSKKAGTRNFRKQHQRCAKWRASVLPIIQSCRQAGLSYIDTANELQTRGVKRFRSRKPWTKGAVARLCQPSAAAI